MGLEVSASGSADSLLQERMLQGSSEWLAFDPLIFGPGISM